MIDFTEGVLVRDVEGIGPDVDRVEELHVAFPVLRLNEHLLQTFEVLPGIEVPVLGGGDPTQSFDNFLGPLVVHHAGVEPLKLIDQDIVEEDPGLAPSEPQGFFRGNAFPSGFFGITEQGILNR